MRILTNIEHLRMCAVIQGHTIGGPAGYQNVGADMVATLREHDQHNQNIKAGDRCAWVQASYWPGLTKRGLSGIYVVKDAKSLPPWLREPEHKHTFTDALRRVFYLKD